MIGNRKLPLPPAFEDPDEPPYEVENRELPARAKDVLRVIHSEAGPGGIRVYTLATILGTDTDAIDASLGQLTYRVPLWEHGERLSRRVGLLDVTP